MFTTLFTALQMTKYFTNQQALNSCRLLINFVDFIYIYGPTSGNVTLYV